MKSLRFRAVWIFVLVTGFALTLAGGSPAEAIVLAQAANGLLLPLIAFFLIFVVNDEKRMGRFRNHLRSNVLGAFVVVVVTGLGVYQLLRVVGAV